MISRLNSTFLPPAPSVRAREKNPAGEDFGALINPGKDDAEVPCVPGNAGHSGKQSADRQMTNATSVRDERTPGPDAHVPAVPMIGASDIEAQTLALSLLDMQTIVPSSQLPPGLVSPAAIAVMPLIPTPLIPATAPMQAPPMSVIVPVQAPSIPMISPIPAPPISAVAPTPAPLVPTITQAPSLQVPAVTPPNTGVAATNSDASPVARPSASEHIVASASASASASAEKVELVSMPWRLQANAGMSYRITGISTQSRPPEQLQHTDADWQSSLSLRTPAGAAIGEAGAAAEEVTYARDGAVNFVAARVQRFAVMTAAADVAMPGRTAAALMLWPHRLLRWLADSDAGTTAWVRDYRLDASQATQLVDSLRCLANQQGHPLHRIMLNGHELWRAPATPDSH